MGVLVNGWDNIGRDEFPRLHYNCIDESQFFAQIGVNMYVIDNFRDELASVHRNLVCHYRLN